MHRALTLCLLEREPAAVVSLDSPFGLPKSFDDPWKELPFSTVYSGCALSALYRIDLLRPGLGHDVCAK